MLPVRKWAALSLALIWAVALIVYLRGYIIEEARADLLKRKFFTFEILGSRIPCNEVFDVGVSVIYQLKPSGTRYESARLCRSAFGGEWQLIPG